MTDHAQRPLDLDADLKEHRYYRDAMIEECAQAAASVWAGNDFALRDQVMEAIRATVTSTVGEAVEKTDGGASTTPARLAPGCCSAISPCAHQRKWPNSICDVCLHATLSSTNRCEGK